MIKRYILGIFSLLAISSLCCGQSINHPFTIIGTIDGLADSTKLYLFDYDTQTHIDSTLAKGNSFVLKGRFSQPKQLAISTAYPDYKAVGFFWVDSDTIRLTGTLNRFKQAVITGSKTEDENSQYKALLLPIQHKRDSLQVVKRKLQYKDSLARTAVENGFIALEKEEQRAKVMFIKQHPDSYVSAEFLRLFTRTKELLKATIQLLFAGLSPSLQQSMQGQHVQTYLNLSADMAIGKHFIDFTQPDLNSREVKLSDVKAKYILLEFWSSGCIPCRAENPQMVELYHKYHSLGLEIVDVSLDTDKERWKKAIEQDRLPWRHMSDLKGGLNKGALIYNVSGVPASFLLNSKGIIVGKDLRREKLKRKLAQVFGKK